MRLEGGRPRLTGQLDVAETEQSEWALSLADARHRGTLALASYS